MSEPLKALSAQGRENWDRIFGPKPSEKDPSICVKCGGRMKPGKALVSTYVRGMPDFPGQKIGITVHAGGPGKVVDVMKCAGCGYSVTPCKLPLVTGR